MLIYKSDLKNTLFWLVMLLPFISVNYITSTYSWMTTVYAIGRYLVIIVLSFRLVYYGRGISVPMILALIIIGIAFISSRLNGISMYRVFSYSILFVGLAMIVDDGMQTDSISLLRAMVIFFGGLIIANYIFMKMYPDGVSIEHGVKYYLFGSYNTTIRKLIPGIYCSVLLSFYRKKRITVFPIVLFLLLFLFCLHVWSVTSSIGLLIFGGAVAFFIFMGKQGPFRYWYFFIGSIILTLIFAVFQNFQVFSYIIMNILKKDMTLSTRTTVWKTTILMIKNKVIWGYGQVDNELNRRILGAASAHNVYLDALYFGGIVFLVILIAVVLIVGRKLQQEYEIETNIVTVASEGLFCAYFLMWNFEPFADLNSFYVMFAMFTMVYHCNFFVLQEEILSTRS